eukprot:TRINITY_DN63406_c0_g1_i1.p2 TRINITY_DN63406_c0_g1~~TRINITY_DN63406_c0_g1_i1.p2  ORF type:complete len:110 (+),score=1.18 TRINITY_DN63406_c0_g1_i1:414-743(+)
MLQSAPTEHYLQAGALQQIPAQGSPTIGMMRILLAARPGSGLLCNAYHVIPGACPDGIPFDGYPWRLEIAQRDISRGIHSMCVCMYSMRLPPEFANDTSSGCLLCQRRT